MSDLLNSSGVAVPTVAPATTGVALTPVDLALPLMDFQQEAVAHALRDTASQGHTLLALEMGLGKTPCGIAVAAAAQAQGLRTLVVVPPSLRINWAREFAKFAPWLSVATLQGTKPYDLPGTDVVVAGDSQVDAWQGHLTGFGALVVDESHRFKNHKAKRTAALAKIAAGCGNVRVLLSGTPMPNGRHAELAGQIEVLGHRAWSDIGGKAHFWGRFAPKIDSWGGRDSAHADELHDLLVGSFVVRRKRDEVIDLPNKGRSIVSVECQGPSVRKYVQAEDDLISWLQSEGRDWQGAARAEALVRLTTLRKLAGEAKVRGAVEHVKELLDEQPGGVFVVAEHRDVIDALVIGLAKYNPGVVQGGMSDTAKQAAVDAFCDGSSRVLVGQITAAGVGLTLHGGGINHRVVVVQLPWTPAELKQAEDRLHRIGQTNDVEVEVLLAHIDGRWTIDERLWSVLEDKNFSTGEV
ncbi:MAG: DEAD/DEAH box helicase, partial [Ilumatobacteraceae bacterium]